MTATTPPRPPRTKASRTSPRDPLPKKLNTTITYERAVPTEKQTRIWDIVGATAPGSLALVGYGGAAGGGKTRAIAELAIDLALDFPGNKILVGRKDFSDLRTTTMDQFDFACPPPLIFRKNDSQHWREIRLPEWPEGVVSKVIFRELKDFMGLASEEYGAVLIDEAGEVPLKSALMLLSRLRWRLPEVIMKTPRKDAPWGMAGKKYPEGMPLTYVFCAASNPWPGWFKEWFVDRQLDEETLNTVSGKLYFIPSLAKDNKFLPPDYEARLRALYPADWVRRLMDGRWDAFEGQVYPQFSPMSHQWPYSEEHLHDYAVRVVGGLDFGGDNPTAHYSTGVVGLLLKSSRILIVDEFEQRGSHVHDKQMLWMIEMQAKWATKETGSIRWMGDRSQFLGIKWMRRQGFNIQLTKGGPDSVQTGIARVGIRLDQDAAGFPGMFYLPKLTQLPLRLTQYRWAEEKDENTATQRHPLKVNDDLPDALRYLLEAVDQPYGDPLTVLGRQLPTYAVTSAHRAW